jgi:hypothetical protein
LDFYLWGHLKAKVYSEKFRDVPHLEQRILAVCEEITPDILIRVMNSWVDRLNRCLAQQGGSHCAPYVTVSMEHVNDFNFLGNEDI